MRYLQNNDIQALAKGAAMLGSGGGGNPAYELLIAQYQLEILGPVPLLDISELKDEDLVAPIAFMGAPLVCLENLPSGKEFILIFDLIEKWFGQRPTVIMPAEIGGANGLAPICIANRLKVPVLDADTLGRAFPELQMSSCNLFGIQGPAFLADSLGNATIIHAKTPLMMERLARDMTISFGSNAALACYIMTGKEAKEAVIAGSISKAIHFGKKMKFSSKEIIGSGQIVDILQEVKRGFLEGSFTLDSGVKVCFQNEYLVALSKDNQVLAMTPEIIMPIEEESGEPITSESLKYGLRVLLLRIEAPDIWKTEKGLALVGPQCFGLEAFLCTQSE